MSVTGKIEHSFDYRYKWKSIFGAFFFGSVLGACESYAALTNMQRLIINGVIELSVQQATAFYWISAVMMFGLMFLSIISLTQNLFGSNRIALSSIGLWLPGSMWSLKEKFYEFSSIKSMKIVSIYRSELLQVTTSNSSFAISAEKLSSPNEFKKIVSLMQHRVSY